MNANLKIEHTGKPMNHGKAKHTGFSLIELMIGVAMIAILASAAIPSFQKWMLNTKVRTATESIQNGLQRARSEAIARNAKVAFTLTNPAVDTSWSVTCATTCGLDAAGAVNPVGTIIDSRSGNEGSRNVTMAIIPAGNTSVTFTSLGGIDPLAAAPFTSIVFSTAGSNKRFSVTIGVGGNVRMCDPDQAPGSSYNAC